MTATTWQAAARSWEPVRDGRQAGLQRKFLRFAAAENIIAGKSAFFCESGGPVKLVAQEKRVVGVGTECDDPAAQLPVALDDFPAGVGFFQTVAVSAGVDFQPDITADQRAQDLVEDFPGPFLGIKTVLIGAITDHIIPMAKSV